ncbi:putative NOP5 family protein [uncultured archaeon]|nr:putative NOP5 family protein [uncultured archaeon]
MEIKTWFGKINPEAGTLQAPGDEEHMVMALLEPSDVNAAQSDLPQPDLRALAKSLGFVKSDREYNSRLRDVAVELVRQKLIALTTKEQDLLQAVEALDDLHHAVNLLDERLYEWSRLRQQEIVHGRDLALALSQDKVTGELARSILNLRESRRAMEAEVSMAAESIAPNLSLLAGPLLAARIISRSGGLQRLAEMPASRVQIMGAEKSLFKHLKGHAPSPKHGLIYRHPAVLGAPKRLRGKVSRTLAGKLAIAARMDCYGAAISPELKTSLDLRLADIRQRCKKPK